jgi:prolycopene isomerase
MGGLSAAVYLAQQGYSVLVAERHYRAGGYAHSFKRKKYTFD